MWRIKSTLFCHYALIFSQNKSLIRQGHRHKSNRPTHPWLPRWLCDSPNKTTQSTRKQGTEPLLGQLHLWEALHRQNEQERQEHPHHRWWREVNPCDHVQTPGDNDVSACSEVETRHHYSNYWLGNGRCWTGTVVRRGPQRPDQDADLQEISMVRGKSWSSVDFPDAEHECGDTWCSECEWEQSWTFAFVLRPTASRGTQALEGGDQLHRTRVRFLLHELYRQTVQVGDNWPWLCGGVDD